MKPCAGVPRPCSLQSWRQRAGTDRPLRRLLDAAEDASPVLAVEAVTRDLGRALGATSVSFLIADLSGRALVRLAHVASQGAQGSGVRRDDEERGTVLPFDGGPAEQALRTQQVQLLPPDHGPSWTVLAPVTERGEALGLLERSIPEEPSAAVVDEVRRTAHVLGYVVIASRRHTDLYEWGQRSTQFSLSAEIQRRLLPAAYTCEAGSFTLAAWLEPADSVGGDTFDYSLGRDQLHLSVTDAVGHGVDSALTATLCVGSLRNTRRHGATLFEQAATTNDALLADGYGPEGSTSLPRCSADSTCGPAGSTSSTPATTHRTWPATARSPRWICRRTCRSGCSPIPPTAAPRCHWWWTTASSW